jgi:thiamine biosynthesis lipoprotein
MNTRRQLLLVMAGASGLAGLGLWDWMVEARASGLKLVRRTARALGTDVTMAALHESRETAERAISAAFDELELIEDLMSLYRPESEISRLNRDGILANPHPYFVSVLEHAQRVSLETAGAFDVTVQPLWELYATSHSQGRLPDDEAIETTRGRVDYRKLEVTPERVRLLGEGMAVTLNGVAQGFAADRVLATLRAHGVQNALVNTGELGAVGHKEDGESWTAAIQHPRRADAFVSLAKLDGRCMATSGDYETAFTADRSYNHIFDPATGRSPQTFSSVTVVAPTGIDADALSTAIFVLGLVKGLQLVQQEPGADALFVLKDERVVSTSGFPRSGTHPAVESRA